MTTSPESKVEPAKAAAEPVESAKARVLDDDDIERMIAEREAAEAEEAMKT